MDSTTLQFCDHAKKNYFFHEVICVRRTTAQCWGNFPFHSDSVRNIDHLWTRPGNCGLAQLSVRTEHTITSTAEETLSEIHFLFIQSYYAGKVYSNYAGIKLVVTITKNKQTIQHLTFPNFKRWNGHVISSRSSEKNGGRIYVWYT